MNTPRSGPIRRRPWNMETMAVYALYATVFFAPISKALTEIFSSIVLLFWLISQIQSPAGKWNFLRDSAFRLLLLFLAVVLISALGIEPDLRSRGLRGLLKWLQYLGIFAAAADLCKSPDRIEKLIKVFMASMLLVTVDGIYQLITGVDFLRAHPLHPGRIARMTGPMGAPTLLAAFYLFAAPLAAALTLKAPDRLKRAIWLGLSLLGLLGLILTYSRAALFALASALILLFLRRRFLRWLPLLAAAGIAVIAIRPLRYNYLETLNAHDLSLGLRQEYWTRGFELFREKPWMGHGINTYSQRAGEIQTMDGPYRGYAHNSYLQLAVETGGTGLLFLLAGIGAIFLTCRRSLTRNPVQTALAAGALAFLIQAFVDNHFFALETSMIFWILFGVFLAGKNLEKT